MGGMDDNARHLAGILPGDPEDGCGPPLDYEEQARQAHEEGYAVPFAEDPPPRHAHDGATTPRAARPGARAAARPYDGREHVAERFDPYLVGEHVDDKQAPAEVAEPTAGDPLRGLTRLARVALLGRDRIIDKAREPVPYVWQDIAVAGTIALFAGGPSEGKTTLLFLLLMARANTGAAVSLLGRTVYPAPAGQWIVLIEGEHGEGSTARKLLSSCELVSVDDAALDRVIIIARKAVRLGSPEWADVERLVRAGLVSDIAIDTVARVAPGDANDEREQVAIFDIMAQAIESAPPGKAPTAWACAHTRKGGTNQLEDVAGSAQRTGQADSVLMVKGEKVGGQTVSSTVTFAKLREEPDVYPEPVTWAIVRSDDGRRSMRVTGASGEGKDDRPLEARIEALLVTGPKTKSAVAKELGRSKADVEPAISNLFSVKRIATTKIKIGGREWTAFKLRTTGTRPEQRAQPDEVADMDAAE